MTAGPPGEPAGGDGDVLSLLAEARTRANVRFVNCPTCSGPDARTLPPEPATARPGRSPHRINQPGRSITSARTAKGANMTVMSQQQVADRDWRSSTLYDVSELILDKGMVIDGEQHEEPSGGGSQRGRQR